jgi:hypothetical protein
MGYYVNPPDMSKEKFLESKGTRRESNFKWEETPTGNLPVVLLNNGYFTAAGVAYCEREFEAFTDPSDNRPKTIYTVAIEDLLPVSDAGLASRI